MQASEWRSQLVVWFGASASPSPGPAGCLPSHPPPSPSPFPLPHPLPHCYERCKLQALPPSAAAAIAGSGPGAGPDAGRWPIRRRARADPAPGSGRSGAGPTRTRTWHLRTLVCYHQDCNRNGCVPQRAAAGRDSAQHIVDNIVTILLEIKTILCSLSKKRIIVSFIVDEDNNIVNIVHMIHVYC